MSRVQAYTLPLTSSSHHAYIYQCNRWTAAIVGLQLSRRKINGRTAQTTGLNVTVSYFEWLEKIPCTTRNMATCLYPDIKMMNFSLFKLFKCYSIFQGLCLCLIVHA